MNSQKVFKVCFLKNPLYQHAVEWGVSLLIKVSKCNCLPIKLINKSAVDVMLFQLILSFSRTELYSVAIWPLDAPVLLTSSCFLSFFFKKNLKCVNCVSYDSLIFLLVDATEMSHTPNHLNNMFLKLSSLGDFLQNPHSFPIVIKSAPSFLKLKHQRPV